MKTQIVLLLLAVIAPVEQAKQNDDDCMVLVLRFQKEYPRGDPMRVYLLCTVGQPAAKKVQS